jgi:hypothetical protein
MLWVMCSYNNETPVDSSVKTRHSTLLTAHHKSMTRICGWARSLSFSSRRFSASDLTQCGDQPGRRGDDVLGREVGAKTQKHLAMRIAMARFPFQKTPYRSAGRPVRITGMNGWIHTVRIARRLSRGRPRIEKRLAELNRGSLSFPPGRIGRKRIGWNRLIMDRAAVVKLDEDARCPAPGTPDGVGLQDISFVRLAKSHACSFYGLIRHGWKQRVERHRRCSPCQRMETSPPRGITPGIAKEGPVDQFVTAPAPPPLPQARH